MSKKPYNMTQLNPDTTFERHVYHRDQFAHYLRWTHVLKRAKIGQKILDLGCGSGNLYEVFYRNRYSPGRYLGTDVRSTIISKNKERFPKAEFIELDLVKGDLPRDEWDMICSFEVIEHIGKNNGEAFLDKIADIMGPNTIFLLSTPCYDPKVGAADNHTFDSGLGPMVQEYTYIEMLELLNHRFTINNVWGTFASQRDYKKHMDSDIERVYTLLHEYYDSNLLANLMAPLYPAYSRNCIWEMSIKK